MRSVLPSSVLALLGALSFAACSSGGGSGGAGGSSATSGSAGSGAGSQCTDCTPTGEMTFALPSPAGATLWTATTMDKVLREAAPPAGKGDRLTLSAAKNEFEPFQIVVRPDADAEVTIAITPFTSPAKVGRVEIRKVGYVKIQQPSDASAIPSGYVPDPLAPTTSGAVESLEGGESALLDHRYTGGIDYDCAIDQFVDKTGDYELSSSCAGQARDRAREGRARSRSEA